MKVRFGTREYSSSKLDTSSMVSISGFATTESSRTLPPVAFLLPHAAINAKQTTAAKSGTEKILKFVFMAFVLFN